MDKDTVIEIRTRLSSIKIPTKDKSGNVIYVPCPYVLDFDNSFHMFSNGVGLIHWDDDKQIVTWFTINGFNVNYSKSMGMSVGDRPMVPIAMCSAEYSTIDNIRTEVSNEMLDQIQTLYGLSDDEKAFLYNTFILGTDQRYIINKKQQYGYSSLEDKLSPNYNKPLDEDAQYRNTVTNNYPRVF